ALQDGCRGEPVREAGALVRLQLDEARWERSEWDAWDAVRRDVAEDAGHPHLQVHPADDAGKSVDLEPDARERDAFQELRLAQSGPEQPGAAAEAAERPERQDAACSGERRLPAAPKVRSRLRAEPEEQQRRQQAAVAAPLPDAAALRLQEQPEVP